MFRPQNAICLLVFFAMSHCVSSGLHVDYGVQDQHAGYVPARTAVLPCMRWPNGAKYASLPLTNSESEVIDATCAKFDEFVLEGFTDQPYMRGFSPKRVESLVSQSKSPDILEKLPNLWQHLDSDCNLCTNGPAFYLNSIKERKQWRLWLTTFSQLARNADAVLIPFVTYSYEKRYLDRGLFVGKRAVAINLFLIDTSHGYLLWSGGREGFALNQELAQEGLANNVSMPTWDKVYERLFVEDVWRDFPGRQVYK